MTRTVYSTPQWRDLRERARERDGHTCQVGRLVGGECSGALHGHHVDPVSLGGDPLPSLDGVVTVCESHHPMLEALARRARRWRRCPHRHRTREGRLQCERRLNRA